MRIERTNPIGGYVIYPDGRESVYLNDDIVHALIRLGMEAQQRRDARHIEIVSSMTLADSIRAQPIRDEDIAAALEKANG